ncbi:PhzF family phenazine biosynthesis protein [Calothrix sp. UHCC 0171]|uniref:PhzF family phenazine biosynthesis protein n=1 Tax=Calothrix sp. UHCC 0171 TaxID=3110245 RepID=UPI002B204C48|nr:PhzF family phenazine biosynthesis protein [Calothrix sp. UHCC 0171]MEA5570624.1 PhzF family phenazine biosynthesis protein [Calothrix sp. UHCC 0171]
MSRVKYYIVDVFAEAKYTGNQLAVFINAGGLKPEQMQAIARETNYSETTFILSEQVESGGYNVKIFTPSQEIPFAGHPTLGTAYILQQEIINQSIEEVILNLKVGQIPVKIDASNSDNKYLWMQQKIPTFGKILAVDAIAEVLHLRLDEIDANYPIQEVSTGLPFIIVPLKNLESLKRIKVNLDKCNDLIKYTEAKSILVFCPETYYPENDLNVRVFCHYLGIPEDPATGSANGCLAGYLVEYSYFGKSEINLRVEQGYEINRPSLILLKASQTSASEGIEVNVGGKVIMVAKGEFL